MSFPSLKAQQLPLGVVMLSLEPHAGQFSYARSRGVSDHYRPHPQRVCPAPANILILYIIIYLQ